MSYGYGAPFGRIPPDTVTLFQQTVQIVRSQILIALPAHADNELRAATMELTLEVILRDWRQNGNTSGLMPADITDIRNFVALAASLAGDDLNSSGRAVFRATLKGLLEDWLENWNSPGDPGPPGPIN